MTTNSQELKREKTFFFQFISPLHDTTYTLRSLTQRINKHHDTFSYNNKNKEEDFPSKRQPISSSNPLRKRISSIIMNKIDSLPPPIIPSKESTIIMEEVNPSSFIIPYTIDNKWDIPLIQGIHYDEHELQPFRLLGDDEMDVILALYDDDSSRNQDDIHNKNQDIHHIRARLQSMDIIKEIEKYMTCTTTIICTDPYYIALNSFCQRYYHFHQSIDDDDDNNHNPIKNNFIIPYPMIDCCWDSIQRGMDVFITYSPSVAMSLYYFSLIPGFSIPLINKVLQTTQYLAPPSPLYKAMIRLMDTGAFLAFLMVQQEEDDKKNQNKQSHLQHLHQPILSASTLRPGGKGWKMALRVRCLHAKVRRSILLASSSSSNQKWDIDQYGLPINQEDMAATLLAFSLNVLYGIEFLSGTTLTNQEKVDYMALWRYVGWLLGVDTNILDPCRTRDHPRIKHYFLTTTEKNNSLYSSSDTKKEISSTTTRTIAEAEDPLIYPRILMESLLCHIMNPDDSSVSMAHHLLQVSARGDMQTSDAFSKTSMMVRPSFKFMYRGYLCRRFIGDKLADQLCLPNPWKDPSILGILSYLLSMTILMSLRIYLRVAIQFPCIRRRTYAYHYRGLNKFLFRWEHGKSKNMKAMSACPYYSY